MNRELRNMPSGHDGDGYVSIDGRQLDAFVLSKMELKAEVITSSRRFLRERVTQNAARGVSVSGTMAYYAVTTALAEAVEQYKNGGAFPEITVQGFAEVAGVGRCEVLVTGVLPKSILLVSFDDTKDDETVCETEFTANDFQIISKC